MISIIAILVGITIGCVIFLILLELDKKCKPKLKTIAQVLEENERMNLK